jgi:hypothetical protein
MPTTKLSTFGRSDRPRCTLPTYLPAGARSWTITNHIAACFLGGLFYSLRDIALGKNNHPWGALRGIFLF